MLEPADAGTDDTHYYFLPPLTSSPRYEKRCNFYPFIKELLPVNLTDEGSDHRFEADCWIEFQIPSDKNGPKDEGRAVRPWGEHGLRH